MEENFSKINKTGMRVPVLPFINLKNEILGKNYSLSVAFVDKKTSRKINNEYRKKDKPTNILSFSLSKTEGEIIICPDVVKKEAKNFDRTFPKFLGFLVIHGMLHLKGHEHSSTMEKEETKYDQKYFNRNRYGNSHDKSNRGRIFKGRKIS